MSEDFDQPVPQQTPKLTRRVSLEDAEARQAREVEEGMCVPVYLGEESEENFLGYVRCALDTDGYERKLEKLKAKKGKSHVWSGLELLPLKREAEIGTFFRGINDPDQPGKRWKDGSGSDLEDTLDNLRRVMKNNFVRKACWERIGEEQNWTADQKAALQGNS
jgi:hypothetical protein